MRKSLPVIILLFISFYSNAQLGIIKDPDGYCNVRAEPNTQSKIEDTLTNGRFIYHLQDDETKNNWLLVDYHKGKDHRSGYIHRSRVVYIKDMIQFKKTTGNDTLIKGELNDMQITIRSGAFVKAGRKIPDKTPSGEYRTIVAIDGKEAWGNDTRMPVSEYKSIQFKSGAQTLNFPKSSFNDLFEVNSARYTSLAFDKTTGKVYIEAMNGDAAGSYDVVWVISNGKIEWREEFIPF
ncbi:MAG TPA: SH3 domain-containing protein [Niastella sp.]